MQIKRTQKKVTASQEVTANKNYQAAQNYIKCAIDALAACGKADEFAKDNIANLSTVYFDLDSGKGDA